MLNKKLKKLVNNPKAFVRDSFIFKQKNKFDAKVLSYTYNPTKNDIVIASSGFIYSLQSSIAKNSKVVFIKPKSGHRNVLITTKQHLKDLSLAFCKIGDSNVEVSFDSNGKLVKNLNIEDTFKTICDNKITNIRFAHRKSKEKAYFELQVWEESEDYLTAPKANMISRRLWKQSVQNSNLFELGDVRFLNEILGELDENECNFPIDYVFTWVNSADEDWQKMYALYNPKVRSDANSLSRFVSRDELMYALRAIEKYAPWVRKIHVVSNCKAPEWLDLTHEKINWVDHADIFDAEDLPTFSSHSIEACIHKIPGLANHFIYSNDDFIICRPVDKTDFFEPNGNCKIKLEPWGNVNGGVRIGDPDYLNAARNCQELLHQEFGVKPSQLHCHAPQAMRVDLINELEVKFYNSFKTTRSNKFRKITDIAVTGFLMHHYAYLSGRGVKDYTPTLLIQRNHNYKERFSLILKQKENIIFEGNKRYLSFCVNDGADSHLDDDWNNSVQDFLDNYLPMKSSFEK
ncbi:MULTISPECIES: stealth conserved region 3 domain-containing protein [Aeromonas]|uniref:stealth conserved region 3 domain-containing protein n=1 Tax=Aeromonas hydrophila TaxID=644 RepID=UPI0028D9EB28|nr:stealth conserved region 3 domain-containing protein [Aeromonas dhakensis]